MAKYEKSAGAIVYCMNQEPKFLMLRNTLKTTYWEFPKGKIEKEEDIERTVKREVEEETDLKDIEIVGGFRHTLQWFFRFKGQLIRKEAIYLLVKIPRKNKDKVRINYEHEAFRWWSYKEALENIKGKHNKEMLTKAYEFIKGYEKQKKLFEE
jgi:8-oxo-dGTP pyrophosphatase MutT (NUDIX family)